MSGFSKAAGRHNYGKNFKESLVDLGNVLEQNRKKREREELYKTIGGLVNKWQEGQQQAQMPVQLQEGGTVNNVFSPENMTGKRLGSKTGMNLLDVVPEGQTGSIQDKIPEIGGVTIPETQTEQVSPKQRFDKAQTNRDDFINAITSLLTNPNLDENTLSRIGSLSGVVEKQTERMRPKEPTYFNLGEGQDAYSRDEYGNISKVASNPREQKKDFKVSEDGYFMYWDNEKNDFVKTEYKAPKTEKGQSGDSAAWANLFYRMKKDEETAKENKAKDEKKEQKRYNEIMESEWVPMDQLIEGKFVEDDHEFAKKDDAGKYKKGGAYLYKRPGTKEYRVFFTGEELEKFADSSVPNAPNKWTRNKKEGQEQTLSQEDFISDFEKEVGRQPTATEIEKAKQKGYWK